MEFSAYRGMQLRDEGIRADVTNQLVDLWFSIDGITKVCVCVSPLMVRCLLIRMCVR